MHVNDWETALNELSLGAVRLFEQIDSTNDEAARWVNQGAPDLAVVIANEQTAGRGRAGRRWFTPPDTALAFSLVLRLPEAAQLPGLIQRYTALGSLAACAALKQYGLHAEVKWPNDILVSRRKIGGVLAEAIWQGSLLNGLVIGIGINVKPGSIPPQAQLNFPATCLESEYGQPVDRILLLRALLSQFLHIRNSIQEDGFIQTWEDALAFLGEQISIISPRETIQGELLGLNQDGSLRVLASNGQIIPVYVGDLHLRPVGPTSGYKSIT
jgi:BirA family biotin operon repressor/biotin-[acetyl-CoA-carboxylase] ligase